MTGKEAYRVNPINAGVTPLHNDLIIYHVLSLAVVLQSIPKQKLSQHTDYLLGFVLEKFAAIVG